MIIFVVSILGCYASGPEPRSFVVYRDTPAKPSFAVYSAPSHRSYANRIESILVEFGVTTLTQPKLKRVMSTEQLTRAESSFVTGSNNCESYYKLETEADYVVSLEYEPPYSAWRFKIINMNNNEIQSTYIFKKYNEESKFKTNFRLKETLHSALKGLGIKVRPYYMSYKMALEYLSDKNLGISSKKQWEEYCKSGKKPDYIPENPDVLYKSYGWVSWKKWFKKINIINDPFNKAFSGSGK